MGVRERSAEIEEVGRRLHGGVIQRLCAVAAALGSDAPLEERDRQRCRVELEAALDELRAVIAGEVFGTDGRELRTVDEAIRVACAAHPGGRVAVSLEADAPIEPEVGRYVRDFVDEALHNAIRHARPSRTEVAARQVGAGLAIEVVNDGAPNGAAPAAGSHAGLGLRLLEAGAVRHGLRFVSEPCGDGRWRAALELPGAAGRRFRG
jgi:signal transduction histidine kinase